MSSILIVEDDPSIAQGVSLALRAEHFSVMIAETGNAGFRRAKEESPDLIILDLVLPDLNGEDVCRRLRAAAVGIPILILSSKREEMDKVGVSRLSPTPTCRSRSAPGNLSPG